MNKQRLGKNLKYKCIRCQKELLKKDKFKHLCIPNK